MITDWTLFAISLVIILSTQFIRDMGLKSFTFVGLLTLGIKVMKELLMA